MRRWWENAWLREEMVGWGCRYLVSSHGKPQPLPRGRCLFWVTGDSVRTLSEWAWGRSSSVSPGESCLVSVGTMVWTFPSFTFSRHFNYGLSHCSVLRCFRHFPKGALWGNLAAILAAVTF